MILEDDGDNEQQHRVEPLGQFLARLFEKLGLFTHKPGLTEGIRFVRLCVKEGKSMV